MEIFVNYFGSYIVLLINKKQIVEIKTTEKAIKLISQSLLSLHSL
jgi:hypothetical protein